MTKTTLSLGQPRRRALPTARDLIAQVIDELPDATKLEQCARFLDLLEHNPQCQTEVGQFYFDAIERDIRRTRSKADHDAMRAVLAKKQAKREARQRQAALARQAEDEAISDSIVSAEVERVKRQIISLAFIMPNGKELGDCLGREVASFGSGFQRIAAKVDPDDRVRDALTDQQVIKLMEKDMR